MLIYWVESGSFSNRIVTYVEKWIFFDKKKAKEIPKHYSKSSLQNLIVFKGDLFFYFCFCKIAILWHQHLNIKKLIIQKWWMIVMTNCKTWIIRLSQFLFIFLIFLHWLSLFQVFEFFFCKIRLLVLEEIHI